MYSHELAMARGLAAGFKQHTQVTKIHVYLLGISQEDLPVCFQSQYKPTPREDYPKDALAVAKADLAAFYGRSNVARERAKAKLKVRKLEAQGRTDTQNLSTRRPLKHI
jgi:hypothetical protein